MKALLLSTSLVVLAAGAAADEGRHTTVITPDNLKWTANPAFPKEVRIATLIGDPTKTGETVVQRIKFPPNFTMPPHTHPFSEVVTVISGNIGTNAGEKAEKVGSLLSPARCGPIRKATRTTPGRVTARRSCRSSTSGPAASRT